tara:strand:+ start:730 stop:894 length:165 start_codon:yes stop_codon:yes gene_type:complete
MDLKERLFALFVAFNQISWNLTLVLSSMRTIKLSLEPFLVKREAGEGENRLERC